MKKIFPIILLFLLGLAACESKKPATENNPYAPLLKYIPDDACLVLLLDMAELGKVYRDFWEWVEKLPIVKHSQDLRKAVGEVKSAAATLLLWTKNRGGVDPLYDLKHAAVGFVLGENEELGIVLAMSGKYPADLLRRLLPGAVISRQGTSEAVETAFGIKVLLDEGKTLLLVRQVDLVQVLMRREPDRELFKRHPRILSRTGPGFLLRQSFSQPDLKSKTLRRFQGVRHAELEIGRNVLGRIEASTLQRAEDVEYMLKAWSEMGSGLPYLARAVAYWAVGANLSALEETPSLLRSALSDRQAVIDTLKMLFPERVDPPKIARKGLVVSITASRPALLRYLIVAGAGMAGGVALYRYQAGVEAEARSGWKLMPIVVVNQDMAKGTAIQFEHLAKMPIPEQFISPNMVKPAGFEKAIGRKLKFSLKRGDFLYWYLLGEDK